MRQFEEMTELLDILTGLPDPTNRKATLGHKLHKTGIIGAGTYLVEYRDFNSNKAEEIMQNLISVIR